VAYNDKKHETTMVNLKSVWDYREPYTLLQYKIKNALWILKIIIAYLET
jgi:hypothetical protein